jgi:hypothetical protein
MSAVRTPGGLEPGSLPGSAGVKIQGEGDMMTPAGQGFGFGRL